MGAGKSTIGRLLAKELGLSFRDSDKEIEQRTGASIPWIFDVEGEQGFRDRETQVLRDLLSETGQVIATGGGAMMREENRIILRQAACQVIYLYASVGQQIKRTARDRNRPLLQTANPADVLKVLMNVRDPLYRQVADIIIETDDRPPRLVAQEIMARLTSSSTSTH